ncbi:MAG TPA: MFS transporter [Roseiflexaceae bacterium]|nr:MFS transporter [Roseiflexaceae bacterium]
MTAGPQSAAPLLPRVRYARYAVAGIFALNGLALANWIARIPDVKQQLALSDQQLGVTLFFAAIGALLAQPTVGWLIGRVGSRRMTTVMLIAFCLSVILPGLAGDMFSLMGALFVLGACNGGLDVAMNAQAALVEQRYARPIMSSFHGLWSIGGLAGAAVGGAIATQGIAVGSHLLGVAIVAMLLALVAIRWLVVDDSEHHASGPSFALPPRALLLLGFIAFSVLLCEGAIADWSAVYLREGLRSTPGVAATGYAVFSLLMAAGRLTGDALALRLGPALVVRGGGALVALGIVLAVGSGVPAVAIVGFGLIGAGLSCSFPLILSAAARTPGMVASTGIAAMATAGYTGFLVGPPLIGTLAEAMTLRGALGLLGIVGLLVAVLGGVVGRQSPAHAGAAEPQVGS